MTPPRIELGIYRVSGDRVSHCTTESSIISSYLITSGKSSLLFQSFFIPIDFSIFTASLDFLTNGSSQRDKGDSKEAKEGEALQQEARDHRR